MIRRPLVASRLSSLVVAALVVTGCDDEPKGPLQVRQNALVWEGVVPAGQTVTIRDFAGDIEVRPSADDTVRVVARLEWRSGDPDKSLHLSGATVPTGALICAVWGEGKCTVEDYSAKLELDGSDAKVFFTVDVPAGVRLDLQNISGDVVAAATAPVQASTMNGDIRVVTSVGPVQGETLNGSVDVRMSSLANTDSIFAKTLNGNAFIYLPSLDDAVLDLGVANGSVSSAFAPAGVKTEEKKISGRIGAGTRVVHAFSINGEVALRKLGADGTAP